MLISFMSTKVIKTNAAVGEDCVASVLRVAKMYTTCHAQNVPNRDQELKFYQVHNLMAGHQHVQERW